MVKNKPIISLNQVSHGTIEMDSHADTAVCGSNFVVLDYTSQECDVTPYNAKDVEKNVPIATCATAWDDSTGQTYILKVHQALYMGDRGMEHSLLNPNQLRAHGIEVQDNPFDPVQCHIDSCFDGIKIPLFTQGTVIFANTRTPTEAELSSCPKITLTSSKVWDPHNMKFPTPTTVIEDDQLVVKAFESTRRLASSINSKPRLVSASKSIEDKYSVFSMPAEEFIEPGLCGSSYDIAALNQRLISSMNVSDTTYRQAGADSIDVPTTKTFVSKERHPVVSSESIADRWYIGKKNADQTYKVTSQKGVRSAILPLSRRYRADRHFDRPTLKGKWYTDYMFGRTKSLDGNVGAQVFANKEFFVTAYPTESKKLCGKALKTFCTEFGAPEKLTFDGAKEQVKSGTDFMKVIREFEIIPHVIEPDRHNQNRVEGVIREVRKKWYRIMLKKRAPRRLWDYGLRWVCEIMQRTASWSGSLEGRPPLEVLTGESLDISEYLDFGFYDWCWYHENAGLGELKLGRWLGVSHRVGSAMSFWILNDKCEIMSRVSVSRVTNLESETDSVKARKEDFSKAIAPRLGSEEYTSGGNTQPGDWYEDLKEDPDFMEEFHKVWGEEDIKEADATFTPDVFDDTYLNMELTLPHEDGQTWAKVTKRLKDANGLPIGTANENPLLDSRVYEVEYSDGHKTSLAANIIAENLFAQVDDEGNRFQIMSEIVDHRTTGQEIRQQDAFVTTQTGTKRRRETTKGWEILVEWKDGSTTWVQLKDLKESYPVQLAEYAVQARISEEPAFAWWCSYVLRKRNRIISKVKSKYWQRTHKYGIRVPHSMKEAIEIDQTNGNRVWQDATNLEMVNIRPALEVWENEEDELIGYQKIKCHLIFDIKLGENFRRKARYVAGGHTTETPASLTYSSVVSRDSVRIAFLLAALNGLDIKVCDIQNAYLTADCREKIYTIAGPEFGSERGKIMIVKKALYGLKSSGAAFRALLAERLYEIGFEPSKADPDVWMRPGVKPDGFEYWEYILVYVDDVLCVSHDPLKTLQALQKFFKLKGDKIEEPEMYLGAEISKMQGDNGEFWTMSGEKYVKTAVSNLEDVLTSRGHRLPTKCYTPLSNNYKPELDTSQELKADGVVEYQELVGVLRWAVELGRVDINLEVSKMSSYLASPRIGHLQQIYHIFGYLKQKPKRKLGFDPTEPLISEKMFKEYDWQDFYRDAKEAIPKDAPTPRGRSVSTHSFVDADHASNTVTRRSQTGVLIFINSAPIMFFSKKQNTVEISTFGSEFIASRIAIELIESLRYKLRMFGVPLQGPTNLFMDNEAVYQNTSVPESTLKKKHLSCAYHRCREAVAAGTVRIAKEGTATNLADLFTKILAGPRHEELLDMFTY